MLGHSPGLVADQKDQRDSTRTLVGGAGTSGCRRGRACERHVNVLRLNLGRYHLKEWISLAPAGVVDALCGQSQFVP